MLLYFAVPRVLPLLIHVLPADIFLAIPDLHADCVLRCVKPEYFLAHMNYSDTSPSRNNNIAC